jgi:hypothetical protein
VEALRIDGETGTTYWSDAISKEMGGNIIPALRILEQGEQPPVGSKQIPCHIVFDVKMTLREKRGLWQEVTLQNHQVCRHIQA